MTRYVSISLSPLILSAPSKTPPWKLRLVSSPSSLAVVSSEVVPMRMPEPIATGSCMMSSIACCQKRAYRPGWAMRMSRPPRTATAFKFFDPITAPIP